MKPSVDKTVHDLLNTKLKNLEENFQSDILCYYGAIVDGNETNLVRIVEDISKEHQSEELTVLLTTNGGSASTVERYVNIIRNYYSKVNFVVPDFPFFLAQASQATNHSLITPFHPYPSPLPNSPPLLPTYSAQRPGSARRRFLPIPAHSSTQRR